MDGITRRNFIEKSMIIGAAGVAAPSLLKESALSMKQVQVKDDISLTQWALVEEIQKGIGLLKKYLFS